MSVRCGDNLNESDRLLLMILAQSDALFYPCRKWGQHTGIVLHERRALYRDAGVHWKSPRGGEGSTVADRKAAQRKLADLRLEEFVESRNPSGSRTVAVKLTAAGDAYARARANIPSLWGAMAPLNAILALADHPEAFDFFGARWVRETTIAGTDYGKPGVGEKLVELQNRLLPALLPGLVESNSDTAGRVSYTITAAGKTQRLALAREPDPAAEPSDEAQDFYTERLEESESELRGAKPIALNNLGIIPLPHCPERRGATRAK